VGVLIIILSPFIVIFIYNNIIGIINKKNNESKKEIKINKYLLIPIVLFILIILITHIIMELPYSNEYERLIIKNAIENNEAIEILPDDIINQFINDPVEADDLYKGKILQITGIIDYIGIPKDNPPKIDNSYIKFTEKNNVGIIFYFTNNKIVPNLKGKKENEIITIVGKYRDYMIIKNEIYIVLGDCEILGS